MAKREVPDFDAVAAFDKALAQQKPDLAARLGSHTTEEPAQEGAAGSEEEKPEPLLKIVPTVRKEAAVERKKSPSSKSSAPPRRRGVVARANGDELRRLTVYVDLPLAQRLRKYCFDHELNLSEVAAEAMAAGLDALLGKS